MKKLIGIFLLSFCLSANAQFGDLFKGLEKLAKDLEGGTQQQQQAQPSNSQQTQTAQTTKLNSGISSGLLNLFVGRWSTEETCLNNSFNKFGIFISVKDNQLIGEQMLAKTQGGQPELIRKFVFINGKILNDEQKIYELSGILEDYLTSKQTEFIQTIKFENNYTRSTIKLIDAGKTTVDNGIIISSGQPIPKTYNCNHKEMIAKVSSNPKQQSQQPLSMKEKLELQKRGEQQTIEKADKWFREAITFNCLGTVYAFSGNDVGLMPFKNQITSSDKVFALDNWQNGYSQAGYYSRGRVISRKNDEITYILGGDKEWVFDLKSEVYYDMDVTGKIRERKCKRIKI